MKIKLLTTNLILAGAISVANAGKLDDVNTNVLSSESSYTGIERSVPDSVVTIDFSVLVADSWDAQDDASNMIANCVLGGTVTGIEWTNVTVESVGASWLSEAAMGFSDSAGGQAINLRVGIADGNPGVGTYSSGGIIDFTDNSLPDIVALGDGLLPIQFFETFDDIDNSIDANFTAGTVDIWGIGISDNPNCQFAVAADADLQMSVTNNASGTLNTGDTVTFTQTILNNGPGDSANTIATSTIGNGLTYVSNTCGATVSGSTVTWNVGTIVNGANASCDIVTTVSGFGQLSFGASVSSDNDLVAANNGNSTSVNGPARVIPTLSQYGLVLMLAGLFFVARRRFAK